MDFIAGYLRGHDVDVADLTHELTVTASGRYRLIRRPEFETTRPDGRDDFQLLYVAAGAATFLKSGDMHTMHTGDMVLYRPGEPQRYVYRLDDAPLVRWVHFSGTAAARLVGQAGFDDADGTLHAGADPAYDALFEDMLQELQLQRDDFEELATMDLRRLLRLIRRGRTGMTRSTANNGGVRATPASSKGQPPQNAFTPAEIPGTQGETPSLRTSSPYESSLSAGSQPTEQRAGTDPRHVSRAPYILDAIIGAARYCNENYTERISVADMAARAGLSTGAFIRIFRETMGETPLHYITSIRISQARMLLDSTSYPIGEIADMVGYDNPLYFSRLFRARTGRSPSAWRARMQG